MNFVYDPVNAPASPPTVQYIPPVMGVQDELRKMGGDAAALADSPLLFPDAATLANLKSWGNLTRRRSEVRRGVRQDLRLLTDSLRSDRQEGRTGADGSDRR